MIHREILKHNEQQSAYLSHGEKAKIAERRKAHRKTQHSNEHTFENTNKKLKKKPDKNLADAQMPQADNPESTPPPKRRTPNTYNNRQSKETEETPIKTDAKPKPKHDTEKDTSRSTTHCRKATRQHLWINYLNVVGSGQKPQMEKIQN